MTLTYLVFGNPIVDQDNLAVKLIPQLKKEFPKIKFIHTDATEDLSKYGKHINIIDVAVAIKDIKIFNLENDKDLEKLQTAKLFSMHDFDLGYNLKLLKKLKKITSAKIICIPNDMNEDEAIKDIRKLVK